MDLAENAENEDKDEARDPKFSKGQSKRIWNELYKVIDSSDVVLQVLDARDPMGTRSKHIEEFMQREKKHKHLVFILNKCDLVPTWVTRRWVAALSSEYPTLAFHASVTNPFGKGALIQLLRQFGKLHQDKKNISVGFIGYPNVGKSSIINTLKKKKVCKTAPIPGETKVWQYVTLMRKIYLIDCPGVVYPTGDTETEIILKGVVRVENLQEPAEHIEEVLKRVKKAYIIKTYKVETWTDTEDFLEKFCKKAGRLLKGGEPDINTVAKMILHDFQRGRLPYFVAPPKLENNDGDPDSKDNGKNDNMVSTSDQTESKITTETPSVKQNFKDLQIVPEFTGDDCMTGTVEEEDINDEYDSDVIESDDESENELETTTEENLNKTADTSDNVENKLLKSHTVDDEISFQYFDRVLKKYKSKSMDSLQDSDDEESEKNSVNEDRHYKVEENKSVSSDEEVQNELFDILTPEERKFLGLNGLEKTEPSKETKYKLISSPAAVCVEAVESSDTEENIEKDTPKIKSKKRKRRSDVPSDGYEGKKRKHEKAPRMTTNKGKTGSRYYETANVKNKNKSKKKDNSSKEPRNKKKQ